MYIEEHDESPDDEKFWVIINFPTTIMAKKFSTFQNAIKGMREIQKEMEAIGGKVVFERMPN